VRKSGVGNIFIKNLDPSIGHKELYDTFSDFGNILSCKVALYENGSSKGFGFVHFENQESANRAIEIVNDKFIHNRRVYVGKFESKKERNLQKESSWTNVYIKDLALDVSERDIANAFSRYGKITSAVIMRGDDGTSKGFGFVNFEQHENASKAVNELHQNTLMGKEQKPIWCGRAQKRSERESELKNKFKLLKMEQFSKYNGINLYVKNLDDDVKEDQLRTEFSTFGAIRSLKIMTDDKKNSRGFGFICFEHPEEAQRAISEMNNRPLTGSTKPLYVTFHEPKEIRRQKLAQEQLQRLQRKQNIRPNVMQPVYPPPGYSYPSNAGPAQYMYPSQMVRQPPRGWVYTTSYPQAAQPTLPRSQGRNPASAAPRNGPKPAAARRGQPTPVQHPPIELALTLEHLSLQTPEQQKFLLGEKLYIQIHKKQPDRAGKITGMLLDSGWGIDELFSLLESEEKLNQKIEEAVNVLLTST
jgi:polyadenylate-binding protein